MGKVIIAGRYSPKQIQDLLEAARDMPRHAPEAGCAGTVHGYFIPASHVWALDAALKAMGITTTDKEQEKFFTKGKPGKY